MIGNGEKGSREQEPTSAAELFTGKTAGSHCAAAVLGRN